MSYVTNVLLSFDILENEDERMAEVQEYAEAWSNGQRFGDIWNSEAYGGNKAMEVPLYAAAFNYIQLTEFVGDLGRVNWKTPKNVRLFVCDQHEDTLEPYPLPFAKDPG